MCSSPKGSTTKRRQAKTREFNQMDYQEYASMVERASAVYDRIEKEKQEKKKLSASQQSISTNTTADNSISKDKSYLTAFSRLKAFLSIPCCK